MSVIDRMAAKGRSEKQSGEFVIHGVTMTRAVRWEEDSNRIVRSTEFDVFAEGEDWDSALNAFVETLGDYHAELLELVRSGDATDHEREVLDILTGRLIEATRHETRQVPMIAINFRSRRKRNRKLWRSLHENSSLPLNA